MIHIRHERPTDAPVREALLDLAFGACRFDKVSEHLREGCEPAAGLSFVATATMAGCAPCRMVPFVIWMNDRVQRGQNETLVGTVRLWHIAAGARAALLLGPLAVHPSWRGRGIGAALMRCALAQARLRGHSAVLLVGDGPYYARFGFTAEKTERLWLPGPYEPERLLSHELEPGALDGAHGLIRTAPVLSARLGRGVTFPAPVHHRMEHHRMELDEAA